MKRNMIISALASLAVAATVFTGCPSSYPDLTAVSIPAYIVGGFKQADVDASKWKAVDNGGNDFFPIEFSETDDGKIAEFTWKQDSNKWSAGFPTDTMDFQLALEVGWDAVWDCGEALTLNDDYKTVAYGKDGENITLSGLKQGETYTMKILMEGSDVKIKVEGKAETFTELTLIADGMPYVMDRLNGTYTQSVTASGDSLKFIIYDGSKKWGLDTPSADDKTYACKEVTGLSSLTTTAEHMYKFSATLSDNGVPSVTISDLKPIELKAIVGDLTDWTTITKDTASSTATKNVYVYTFTADESKFGGWSDNAHNIAFKICTTDTQDWDATNYGGVEVKLNGEEATLEKNPGMANSYADGLEDGKEYIIIITTDASSVKAKLCSLTTVTVSLDETLAAKASLKTNSNITWRGVASGSWSADKVTFTQSALSLTPNNTAKTAVFYVTGDYDITGQWTDAQKKEGTNFKLEFDEDTSDPKGGWFKLDTTKSAVALTYSEKKN